MIKIEVTDIMIEVTRRCNMKCCHCLCGDAQNVDIDFTYIINILKHVSHIEKLIFTGGEPSLNITAIKFTLNQIKRRKIKVGRFIIVTNGSLNSIDPHFIEVCNKLYEYQYEEEDLLYLSNDEYHDNTHHVQVYSKLSKLCR